MARQSMPRFDLYEELGVDPSADTDAIEAAYRRLKDRGPDVDAADNARRVTRLRLARDWLTDSERRNRYDASRARAAVRAAARTANLEPGMTAPESSGAGTIPWPAADLDRPVPNIERTSTPIDADAVDAASKARARLPIGAMALVALAIVVAVGTYLFATSLGSTNVARVPTASPPPVQASHPETPSPQPEPTAAPTTEPTSAPTPAPSGVELAVLRQGAWDMIQALEAAAATGDVATAQTMLGETAPGLLASGLRRAAFPQVEVGDISAQREGEPYVALAGDDRLTSTDGLTWTFDYADRPLAAYRSPGAEPVHDLWWVESDGEHHLYLQVAVATVSRSGVTVKVTWSFDPSRPDDATYFRRAGLVISSVTLDETPSPVTATALPMAGVTTLMPSAMLDGAGAVPSRLVIGITVTNPRSGSGSDRANETVFTLNLR